VPQAALTLNDVGYSYPGRPDVLRHVTFPVPKSNVSVIMGANGSGKTTLIRIAAGLVRPQRGAVLTSDDVPAHEALRRGRIGYIPQQLGLVRSASVLDNVLQGGLRRGGPLLSLLGVAPRALRDEALAALDAVGLREKERQRVRDLSGGERQRVAIARTLVQRPDVLIADEIIASLDALQAHAVMETLRSLKRQGVTMLLTLHHIDVALANADYVAFLVRGSLTNPRAPHGMTPEEARWALTA